MDPLYGGTGPTLFEGNASVPKVVAVPVQPTQSWDLGTPRANSDAPTVIPPAVVDSPIQIVDPQDLPRGSGGANADPRMGNNPVISPGRRRRGLSRRLLAAAASGEAT